MGILRRRWAEAAGGVDRTETARRSRGYRERRAVLRLPAGRLDHRPGAQHRRRQVVAAELRAGPLDYVTERKAEILNELIAFARIPSVSTDPAYLQGIASGAEWVAERMRRAGLENVQINPTSGHPVVTCDWLHAEGAPTILIYGHYDVQPPDPLEKWKSPPFQPTVRDNRLYARGVSDDKGPMLIPIKTAEAYLKTVGKLPINVKFVIE